MSLLYGQLPRVGAHSTRHDVECTSESAKRVKGRHWPLVATIDDDIGGGVVRCALSDKYHGSRKAANNVSNLSSLTANSSMCALAFLFPSPAQRSENHR